MNEQKRTATQEAELALKHRVENLEKKIEEGKRNIAGWQENVAATEHWMRAHEIELRWTQEMLQGCTAEKLCEEAVAERGAP